MIILAQTVTFYKTSDDPKKVNKAITKIKATGYNLTRPCNVLNPVFTTSYDSDIAGANYCYITSPFNRYYFVTDINLIPGGKMEVICKVDPLMSWKGDDNTNGFLKSKGTIIRAEHPLHGTQLYDSKYPLAPKMELDVRTFSGTVFEVQDGVGAPYLLSVMGKETGGGNGGN